MIASKSSATAIEAASLIVHRIPDPTNSNEEHDNWDAANCVTLTVKTDELMDLNDDMEKLFNLLYNEVSLIVPSVATATFQCQCLEK